MDINNINDNDRLMMLTTLQVGAVAERLFDALKLAGLPITGPGMDRREEATKWLSALGRQMGDKIRTQAATLAPTEGMRVKSIKTMSPTVSSKQQKKKSK